MLQHLIDSLSWFFGLKLISDYIFPVASGIYLTFVTASVIQFIDMRRAAVRAFEKAVPMFTDAPRCQTFGDWSWLVALSTKEPCAVLEELRIKGHTNAAAVLDRFWFEVHERLMRAQFKACKDDPAFKAVQEKGEDPRQLVLTPALYGSIQYELSMVMIQAVNEAKSQIGDLWPDVTAVLQLRSIRTLVSAAEKYYRGRFKRPSKCPHCGGNLDSPI